MTAVRVCAISDAECSRGCGAGACKQEVVAADAAALAYRDGFVAGAQSCVAAQPDERAAFEEFWQREMNVLVMDLHRHQYPMMPDHKQPYACHETERAWITWQAARAAAPQAAMTDEQVREVADQITDHETPRSNWMHARICRILREYLSTAPTERMSDAARDAEDAARLDWLDKNMWHREKNLWDAKTWAGHAMWVTFAPDGIQGSARRIIDAARKAEIERSGQGGEA